MQIQVRDLPPCKIDELNFIKNLSCQIMKPEILILFGPYASGKWVENMYFEDQVLYDYKSSFNILLITESRQRAQNKAFQGKIHKVLSNTTKLKTPVSFIYEDIDSMNQYLMQNLHFFTSIKEEGISLFDSKQYTLVTTNKTKEPSPANAARHALNYWHTRARVCFEDYENNMLKSNEQKYLNKAAFELHQVCENSYSALSLVFTEQKTKTHNLRDLKNQSFIFDPILRNILSEATENDKKLFDLLSRAYVEARYNKQYSIEREELEQLAIQVKKLLTVSHSLCQRKIKDLINV